MTLERTTVHINDDTGRVAMYDKRTSGSDSFASSAVRYVYSNHLSTASLELDGSAAIISYEEYHPYGTSSYKAMNASVNAVAKRYKYTGKERDEETGLYYIGARYYCPWLARWCADDPINSEWYNLVKGAPQRNRERDVSEIMASGYEYCYDNPVRFTDPTGEQAGTKHNIPAEQMESGALKKTMENATKNGNISYVEMSGHIDILTTQNLAGYPQNPFAKSERESSDGITGFDLLNYGEEGLQAFFLSPFRAIGNNLRKAEAITNGETSYNRMIFASDELGTGFRTVEISATNASPEQIINDLDMFSLGGGGGASTFIAKGHVVKPSTVADATEKTIKTLSKSKKLWTLTEEGASKVMQHGKWGKFYKTVSDGTWWAKDLTGHGGSAFKVFKEGSKGLEWLSDADKYGTYITGKHKSNVGTFIPWEQLKTFKK